MLTPDTRKTGGYIRNGQGDFKATNIIQDNNNKGVNSSRGHTILICMY
jgi:hypothetical protein